MNYSKREKKSNIFYIFVYIYIQKVISHIYLFYLQYEIYRVKNLKNKNTENKIEDKRLTVKTNDKDKISLNSKQIKFYLDANYDAKLKFANGTTSKLK